MHDMKIRHKENCRELKMQDWKMRHKKCRAGKCETSQYEKRKDTYNTAVARKDVLHHIQFLLQYWPLKSSKLSDFHVI